MCQTIMMFTMNTECDREDVGTPATSVCYKKCKPILRQYACIAIVVQAAIDAGHAESASSQAQKSTDDIERVW
jgi:hypothetical protein